MLAFCGISYANRAPLGVTYLEFINKKAVEENRIISQTDNFGLTTEGLYLVPSDVENLRRVVVRGVKAASIQKHLNSVEYQLVIQSQSSDEMVHLWSTTARSRKKFDEINLGDWMLFSPAQTGLFTYSCRIVNKLESRSLGSALWPKNRGLPWELFYFVDDVQEISISKKAIVRSLGYSINFNIPGIIRVHSLRIVDATEKYGGIKEMISSLELSDIRESQMEEERG